MYRISKLQLRNFRSIKGEETIDFTQSGQNLLIYGENGSGKSSICIALLTFFETADQRRTNKLPEMAHIHLPEKEKDKASIEVTFLDQHPHRPPTWKGPEKITLTKDGFTPKDKAHLEFLREANRLRGHLDYRNLLKTYLIERKTLNLFFLFVEKVFERIKNPETKRLFGLEWEDLYKRYSTRLKFTEKEKDMFIKDLESFSRGLKIVLDKIEPDVNRLLKRFDPLMTVRITFSKVYLTEKGNFGGQNVSLKVKYDKHSIDQHHDFFNEARLSALGLSVYLASFLYHKNEPEYENAFKLLLLDDIFIGIDMGNRIPLLKILQEDFIGYQIIMTTYDLNWYEVARHYLPKNEWKPIKFFIETEQPGQHYTKILDDQLDDPLGTARKYFGLKDYQACANYQRKALERRVKELLPETFRKQVGQDGNITDIKSLSTKFKNLLKWLKDSGFETKNLEDFELYTKILLNPLSHDNVGSPVFRQELEAVFQILSDLETMKTTLVIPAKDGANLKVSYEDTQTKVWHQYKVVLYESLWRIEWKGETKYAPCLCSSMSHKEGKLDWSPVSLNKKKYIQEIHNELLIKHHVKPQPFERVFRNNHNEVVLEINAKADGH